MTLQKIFAEKKAYIAYLTGGQIPQQETVDVACALEQAGVDILEFGIPFSDPIADGPVIQQAMETALERGTKFDDCLDTISKIKQKTKMPIILFGYANMFLKHLDRLEDISSAGVDHLLMVDIAIEEMHQEPFSEVLNNISPIYLVSPSSTNERIQFADQNCDSFLYYVSRNGTTGVKSGFPDDFAQKMQNVTEIATNPVVTGFGISSKELARQACEHSAGFVVGSYFVKAIQQGADAQTIETLAQELDPRI